MTDSPQAEPLGFETIDEVLTILRERGQRISTACRLVLEALFAADGPASAQFIADALTGRDSTPDPASVYRNLERLERLGVVKHVHLGHGPGLYMLVGAGGRSSLPASAAAASTASIPASSTRSAARSGGDSDTRRGSTTSRSSDCAPNARQSTRAGCLKRQRGAAPDALA